MGERLSAVAATLEGIPWVAIRQDPRLAQLTLEVIELLEQIDEILGVTSVDPKECFSIKKELKRLARRR